MKLIQTQFVSVAVATHDFHRKDADGEFLRALVQSHPYGQRHNEIQGLFVFDPAGKLYAVTDQYGDAKLAGKLRTGLEQARAVQPERAKKVAAAAAADPRLRPALPEGGRVVRVLTKNFDDLDSPTRFAKDLGYENMWLRKDEAEALAKGVLPDSLKRRVARYHLLNSYTGEGELWHRQFGPNYVKGEEGVREFELTLEDGRLRGHVYVYISPTQYYRAALSGVVEAEADQLSRFDLVANGPVIKQFFNDTPVERATQVIAFRLAGDEEVAADAALRVPPGFSVHDPAEYLK